MNHLKGIFIIVLVWLVNLCSVAQDDSEASLYNSLRTASDDTTKAFFLNELAWKLSLSDPDTALVLSEQALEIAENVVAKKAGREKQCAQEIAALAKHQLASFYLEKTNFSEAKKYYDAALSALDELAELYPGRKQLYASRRSATIGDLGHLYSNLGQYPEALNAYLQALKIDEKNNNKEGIGRHLGSIGSLYHVMGDYEKALSYLNRALEINRQIKNDGAIASVLVNTGGVYHAKSDYTKGLECLFSALEIDKKIGNKQGQAIVKGNIAVMYDESGNQEKATEYYLQAIAENEAVGNLAHLELACGNLGLLYTDKGNYTEAEKLLRRSLQIAQEIRFKDDIRTGYENLALLYQTMADSDETPGSLKNDLYEKSLEHYKQAAIIKDSLFNDEKKRELTRHEMTYEFEKKESAAKAEQEKKDAVASLTKKKQRLLIALVSGALLLTLAFSMFVSRSLRLTKKQKAVIELKTRETELQKVLIEEKNKDIMDSIFYARRIQRSLLPTEKYIGRNIEQLKKS